MALRDKLLRKLQCNTAFTFVMNGPAGNEWRHHRDVMRLGTAAQMTRLHSHLHWHETVNKVHYIWGTPGGTGRWSFYQWPSFQPRFQTAKRRASPRENGDERRPEGDRIRRTDDRCPLEWKQTNKQTNKDEEFFEEKVSSVLWKENIPYPLHTHPH